MIDDRLEWDQAIAEQALASLRAFAPKAEAAASAPAANAAAPAAKKPAN